MRTKLTALIALGAALAVAAVAYAGPVTVAFYQFATQSDVLAFQKTFGSKCDKKWRQNKSMQITLGAGTSVCAFRTSVVADSSDLRADAEISTTAALGTFASKKLQKKAFVGVAARSSETAGYELRVRPFAQSWQLFRDPKGSEGMTLFRSGNGKFIKAGLKGNGLLLRAFDFGSASTSLTASINGKVVASATDTGNGQPDGRRTVVTTGVKGTGSGSGVVGIFDDVAIKVPNPF